MNKINQLLNEEFVIGYFKKKILPHYPNFKTIKKVKIIPHKRSVWEHTYHVVLEFKCTFIENNGKSRKLPIFCTAHSSEPRRNVYTSLSYLWNKGFDRSNLTIPHPLFYSKQFRGTFYRGVKGKNLYHFIKRNEREEINSTVPLAAKWFAKLHNTRNEDSKNFNKKNSRIKTVMPGIDHIFERISHDYPEYLEFYQKAYSCFIEQEKSFLKKHQSRWLVHGDAHPENIIRMSKNKIAVIDFTDLCLTDFCRDLGTFIQQIEYMMNRKIGDENYTQETIDLFLKTYFQKVKKAEYNKDIENRINNYYNWTTIRTATHFLLKEFREPDRAVPLIEQIKKNLNI